MVVKEGGSILKVISPKLKLRIGMKVPMQPGEKLMRNVSIELVQNNLKES